MKAKSSLWQTIKRFRFRSLVVKNCLLCLLLLIVPLSLIFLINYNSYKKEIQRQMCSSNASILEKSYSVTDRMLINTQDAANSIADSKEIKELTVFKGSNRETELLGAKVMSKMSQYISSYRYVSGIYLYTLQNHTVFTQDGRSDLYSVEDKWIHISHLINGSQVYFFTSDTPGRLAICRAVYHDNGEKTGIVVVETDLKILGMLIGEKKSQYFHNLMIVDYAGQVLYSSNNKKSLDKKLLNQIVFMDPSSTQIVQNNRFIISTCESDTKSFIYALVSESGYFSTEENRLKNFLYISVLSVFVCCIIGAAAITFITYRPIKKLLSVVQFPYNSFNDKTASPKENEMMYLVSRLMNNDSQVRKTVMEINEAQARALQFQVTPHFLANTLEIIKWNSVSEFGIGNKTGQMLTKLARFYRTIIEDELIFIPLKKEIEILQQYIDILNSRYEERIRYVYDIDEDAYSCSVIKIILQPLIENAVIHGLKPKKYYGVITIFAKIDGDLLRLGVSDDGVNVPEARLEEINSALKKQEAFSSHVGLGNVNNRIKLIFGEQYGLRLIKNTEGEGITSEITIPII